MNLHYLEIFLVLSSVISAFYFTFQYLLRFQRKIDRILILLCLNSNKIEDVEKYLTKELGYHPRRQVNEELLSELDTDII